MREKLNVNKRNYSSRTYTQVRIHREEIELKESNIIISFGTNRKLFNYNTNPEQSLRKQK
jgi:hypothetical protein